MKRVVRIAAAVIVDDDGRSLLVRKRGTRLFMQPGGKLEPGEDPRSALRRELLEELQLSVAPEDLEMLGDFAAPAANEPGHTVEATVFRLRIPAAAQLRAGAEIEEIAWHDPATPLAPLSQLLLGPREAHCATGAQRGGTLSNR